MRFLILLSVLFRLTAGLGAQTPTIVLAPDPQTADTRAARILQHYLAAITGQKIALQTGLKVPSEGAVVFLGSHPNLRLVGLQVPPSMPDEAYFIHGKNNAFLIAGGGAPGAEYGVYDLLERLGCRKFSPRDSLIPHVDKLRLPDVPPRLETPAFQYRELHYEPAFDASWARWHRLRTRADKDRDWGMFVHTFRELCPPETYFDSHPEYFSWNGAQWSNGQLCLSNDTVRHLVIAALRQKIAVKPDALYWSVSQNDNYDYCKCPRCAASDSRYGSPAGTLLAFVNAVAAEFPEKTISTLAYQYTRRAPTGILPASNVSICLCSIECNRGQPIADGCPDFARDLAEWSRLTDQLMIWDYVVQFRSYVSPFPNWHTLQPNLQQFKNHGVRMVFEQGSGRDQSEFSDMRAYLLAKLMWNPQADVDSILLDFGKGYYGAAQPAIQNYIRDLTASLQASGSQLLIYGIPQTEKFLTDTLLEKHLIAMLDAEDLLQNDTVRQRRLLAARLPMGFARVEKAKTDSRAILDMLSDSPEQCREAFQIFIDNCKEAGFRNLHENGYTPEAYVSDFLAFLERQRTAAASIAYGPELTFPAAPTYAKGDPEELTNRRVGEPDYRYNWLGFQGEHLQAVVRLNSETCTQISVSFLQDQQSWVFFPRKVMFETSLNGQYFEHVYEENINLAPDGQKSVRTVSWSAPNARMAQYVRVTAYNHLNCPAWHSCNGNPCWIFADEIVVR
ncbi:MAG: DUF4838 domain-containing protein [Saprospiraceae bacterium]